MSIKLDAKRLVENLDKLQNQIPLAVKRIQENRAYAGYETQIKDLEELADKVTQIWRRARTTFELISDLEIDDSIHTLFPGDWIRFGNQVYGYEQEIKDKLKPLTQLFDQVEGASAKGRWFSEVYPHVAIPTVRERLTVFAGISDYRQAGAQSLSTCRADAEALHRLLLQDQRYGYRQENTRLLLDDAAQRDNVLKAIESAAQATQREDMLLFYFSGHGSLVDGEPCLIPYDYKRDAPKDSAILASAVMELMKPSHAQAKIIILDACHSGPDIPLAEEAKSIEDNMGMKPGFMERVFEQARGSASITSCVAKQVSWTYRDKGLSAFTHFLCEGLQGAADFQRRGFVTVSDGFHYVANAVQQWAEEKNLKQTPALSYTTTGEIILVDYRQGKSG